MNFKHSAKWYVYELSDPRDNSVFYVGKGSGNRIDAHERDTIKGVCSKKCNKIRSINNSGYSIHKEKVATFWDEQAAYDYETERISFYGLSNLTNIIAGGQSAFERRVKAMKARKDPTALELFVRNPRIFAEWAHWTHFGKYKVKAERVEGNKIHNLVCSVYEVGMNSFVGDLFKKLAADEKARPIITAELAKFNISVEFA